jgi:hypothetical protein
VIATDGPGDGDMKRKSPKAEVATVVVQCGVVQVQYWCCCMWCVSSLALYHKALHNDHVVVEERDLSE